MRISPEVWRGEAAQIQAAADLTWKSQFCNRAFRPLRNIFRSGCSYTRSTGHTSRAMHGREHLRGTDPEWASRSPRSAPSFRPGGDREPIFPNGHRASDWGHTNRCGATSWLLGEGGNSRANVPSWEWVSTTPRGKHSGRDCYALYLSASRNPLNQKNIFVAESLLTKRLLQVFLLFFCLFLGSWSTCLCPLTSPTLFYITLFQFAGASRIRIQIWWRFFLHLRRGDQSQTSCHGNGFKYWHSQIASEGLPWVW